MKGVDTLTFRELEFKMKTDGVLLCLISLFKLVCNVS